MTDVQKMSTTDFLINHAHKLACWKLQKEGWASGRGTGLPSTGREKMEKEGKEKEE